jgi:hypothetical protein
LEKFQTVSLMKLAALIEWSTILAQNRPVQSNGNN